MQRFKYKNVKKCLQSRENRLYEPRVLTELFSNGLNNLI